MDSSKENTTPSFTYIPKKLLGSGSFGSAYLVERSHDKSLAVIKTISIQGMSESEKLEAYKEYKIHEKLNHSNIIKYYEVFITKTPIAKMNIVMDYADGGDLQSKLKAQGTKPLKEKQIIDWFTQICLALKHLHDRKILHRDLKSQNIFLTKNGIIKLGDFGIAKVLTITIEKAQTIVGTPYYLSPEIVNNHPYNFKSDIWSLGVLLYEMIMLKMPFIANNLPMLSLKIIRGQYPPIPFSFSKELRSLVTSLLQVDQGKRPSINQILRLPLIKDRIKGFLNEIEFNQEFSHTVLHKLNILEDKKKEETNKKKGVETERPATENQKSAIEKELEKLKDLKPKIRLEIDKNLPTNAVKKSSDKAILNVQGQNIPLNDKKEAKVKVVTIEPTVQEPNNKQIKRPTYFHKEKPNYDNGKKQAEAVLGFQKKEEKILKSKPVIVPSKSKLSSSQGSSTDEKTNSSKSNKTTDSDAVLSKKESDTLDQDQKENELKALMKQSKAMLFKNIKLNISIEAEEKEEVGSVSREIVASVSSLDSPVKPESQIMEKEKKEMYDLQKMALELEDIGNENESEADSLDLCKNSSSSNNLPDVKSGETAYKFNDTDLEYVEQLKETDETSIKRYKIYEATFEDIGELVKEKKNSEEVLLELEQLEELRQELEIKLGEQLMKRVYDIIYYNTPEEVIVCDTENLTEILKEEITDVESEKLDLALSQIPEIFTIVFQDKVQALSNLK